MLWRCCSPPSLVDIHGFAYTSDTRTQVTPQEGGTGQVVNNLQSTS
jgi:hypothetical protein